MPAYSIKFEGAKEFTQRLKNYPEIAKPIFNRFIAATNAVFAKNTLKNDPVPWRTGTLTQTFEFKPGNMQAVWKPTRNYAIFVHEGTRYIKANPFMPKIRDKSEPEINKLAGQALNLVAEGLAGKKL